jgi:hypothetical protein
VRSRPRSSATAASAARRPSFALAAATWDSLACGRGSGRVRSSGRLRSAACALSALRHSWQHCRRRAQCACSHGQTCASSSACRSTSSAATRCSQACCSPARSADAAVGAAGDGAASAAPAPAPPTAASAGSGARCAARPASGRLAGGGSAAAAAAASCSSSCEVSVSSMLPSLSLSSLHVQAPRGERPCAPLLGVRGPARAGRSPHRRIEGEAAGVPGSQHIRSNILRVSE